MKIVFVGYMASGKSAIAREVALKLKLRWIDLDIYMETKESKVISQIFKEKGEIYFRKIENFYLNELLDTSTSFVLSVGGGTACFSGNMEFIQKKSISIYLKASIQTLCERLLKEKKKRPLLAEVKENNLQEFIAKHIFERAPFYEKSTHIVSVNGKSIKEISDEICSIIEKY